MRTIPEMIARLEEAQQFAIQMDKHGSYEEWTNACERVRAMRDVLGLPAWDKRTIPVDESV